MSFEPFFRSSGPRMMKPAAFRVLLTLAVAFIGLASSVRAQFAYVPCWADNTLWGYSIGSNGALTPVPGSPYPVGFEPTSVAVDQNKFVYLVSGNPDFKIMAFSIGSDGALSTVPGASLPAGSSPFSLTVDPPGRFLFAPIGTAIYVYSIGSNGALTEVKGSPFNFEADHLAVEPSGTYAFSTYLPARSSRTIRVYKIESTGKLTALENYPTTKNAGALVVDPKGHFLYWVAYRCVTGNRITSTGGLKSITGSPYFESGDPTTIVVDRTGKFVYVTNQDNNTVSGYQIVSGGKLKPVPNSPFAVPGIPDGAATDPTGQFLYVTNYSAATVSGYVIGSNGVVTAMAGSPFTSGNYPGSIAITSE
jgi:6-phosphogluconolactonase